MRCLCSYYKLWNGGQAPRIRSQSRSGGYTLNPSTASCPSSYHLFRGSGDTRQFHAYTTELLQPLSSPVSRTLPEATAVATYSYHSSIILNDYYWWCECLGRRTEFSLTCMNLGKMEDYLVSSTKQMVGPGSQNFPDFPHPLNALDPRHLQVLKHLCPIQQTQAHSNLLHTVSSTRKMHMKMPSPLKGQNVHLLLSYVNGSEPWFTVLNLVTKCKIQPCWF